jgi:nucleoid-associated protein YgaU
MLLVGRIVKREEKGDAPLGDTTYLIGVPAMNLAKDVGDTMELVPLDQLRTMKIPDWALAKLRDRFPEAGLTTEILRRQLDFWHRTILPQVVRGRR